MVELALVCCAPGCSLEDLSDGDIGGAGGAGSSAVTASSAGGAGGAASSSGAGLFGGTGAGEPSNDLWSRGFGSLEDNQEGHGVAVDSGCPDGGCALLAGYFVGSVELGAGTKTSAGSYDSFVASFWANGTPHWSHVLGDSNDQRIWSLAADPAGNAVMAGRMRGTLELPGGESITALEGYDGFVAKLDRDSGNALWSRRIGEAEKATPDDNQYAEAVSVDGDGNILVAGLFSGEMTFASDTLTAVDDQDLFVLKLDPDGDPVWATRFDGHVSGGNVVTVAAGPAGEVYVGGVFSGTLGGGCPATTSMSGTDAFVVSLASTTGACKWAHSWKSTGSSQYVRGLAPLAGDVVVALEVNGDIDLGAGALQGMGADIALTRLAGEDGAPLWGWRTGDALNQRVAAVAVDPATEEIVLTGNYEGDLTFGGQASLFTLNGPDIVLARFDGGGQLLWAQGFGDKSGLDYGYAVAVDGDGNELLTGELTLTVQFGETEITSHGAGDIFLAKFLPQAPAP